MKANVVQQLRNDTDWVYRYIAALEDFVTPEQLDIAVEQANRGYASIADLPTSADPGPVEMVEVKDAPGAALPIGITFLAVILIIALLWFMS